MKNKYLINFNISKVSVESIDDKEDMMFADEAFDILGFSKEEKYNIYKVFKNLCFNFWEGF